MEGEGHFLGRREVSCSVGFESRNFPPPLPHPIPQTCTQVNQNLRSFGSMSRNDVQCMMYNHPDGLPATIRSGLNQKVDQLLKVSRFVQFTHASGRPPLLICMAYLFKLTLC